MTYRAFLLMLVAVALALFAAAPLAAEEKDDKNTHDGTFVSAKGDEFTMKDKDGKEHSHKLAKDAKIIGTDGKEAKLGDFKKDQKIRVTTKADDKKVATKVEALK